MVHTEQLARAALEGDALRLRSLAQDWLLENQRLAEVPVPVSSDPTLLTVAAGLVELLAQRRQEPPPSWTARFGKVAHPIYLVRSAGKMRNLRRLCETESPLPLRRRNLLAPPTFLEFA